MEPKIDISEVGGNGGDPIYLQRCDGRLLVVSECEGGYNAGCVDLLNLLAWVLQNKPELLTVAKDRGMYK